MEFVDVRVLKNSRFTVTATINPERDGYIVTCADSRGRVLCEREDTPLYDESELDLRLKLRIEELSSNPETDSR